MADRVNTFGAAFLGLTLECCRCHDHKYDPISQREYYQLAAFFNSIDESGLYSHFTEATPTPTLLLSTAAEQKELDAINLLIEEKEQVLSHIVPSEAAYQDWKAALLESRPADASTSVVPASPADQLRQSLTSSLLGDLRSTPREIKKSKTARTPTNRVRHRTIRKRCQAWSARASCSVVKTTCRWMSAVNSRGNQPFSISLWVNTPREFERAVIFHRSRAWTDSGSRGYELLIEEGRLSAALIHFWPGNALRVNTVRKLPVERWTHVAIAYDGSSQTAGLQIYINGTPAETTVVRDNLSKHILGSDGFGGGNVRKLAFGQRFRDVGFKGGRIDELKIFDQRLSDLQLKWVYQRDLQADNLHDFLAGVPDPLLRDHFRRTQGEFQLIQSELRTLRDRREQTGGLNCGNHGHARAGATASNTRLDARRLRRSRRTGASWNARKRPPLDTIG